jgi:hypothetical protein
VAGRSRFAALAVLVGLAVGVGAAASRAEAPALTSSLTFSIRLPVITGGNPCPPGTPTPSTCPEAAAIVHVRGVGRVDLDVNHVVDTRTNCPRGTASGTLATVRGAFSVSGTAAACVNDPWGYGIYDIGVSGSGAYAGASGTGTIDNAGGSWTLSATVKASAPTFDLTPPRITGIRAHTVRAKTRRGARVRFDVRAADDIDGVVRAVCRPRSGSLFHVGRTRVACRATDSSANSAARRFLVRVVR